MDDYDTLKTLIENRDGYPDEYVAAMAQTLLEAPDRKYDASIFNIPGVFENSIKNHYGNQAKKLADECNSISEYILLVLIDINLNKSNWDRDNIDLLELNLNYALDAFYIHAGRTSPENIALMMTYLMDVGCDTEVLDKFYEYIQTGYKAGTSEFLKYELIPNNSMDEPQCEYLPVSTVVNDLA